MKRIFLVILALVLLSSNAYGVAVLDATKPAAKDPLSVVPTYERETRAKVNEIIAALPPLPDWVVKTVAYNAANGDKVLVDTSAAIATVYLPATPTQGQYVALGDAKGTWATNNVTVNGNGSHILGGTANYTLNAKETVLFVYIDSGYGWGVWTSHDKSGSFSFIRPSNVSTLRPVLTDDNKTLVTPVVGLKYLASYASLSAALTSIGSAPTELVIDFPVTLGQNETIPSTVSPKFVGLGEIIFNGYYLYLYSEPVANTKIFNYSSGGGVRFMHGSVSEMKGVWFGAKGDPLNFLANYDSGIYIQYCMNAAVAAGVPCRLSAGKFISSTQLNMQGGAAATQLPAAFIGAMPCRSYYGGIIAVEPNLAGRCTELHYTGSSSDIPIVTGISGGSYISNFVIKGAGRTTSNSVGVGVTGSNQGFVIQDCKIQGFETGIKTGYDGVAGNGDKNIFERLMITDAYTGVWIHEPNNAINSFHGCTFATRWGVYSEYTPFTWIDGEFAPSYVEPNVESIWTDTVAALGTDNITLTSCAHCTEGMYAWIQGDVLVNNPLTTTNPYNSPTHKIYSVTGKKIVLTGGYLSPDILVGANVIYGYPSIFSKNNAGANHKGVHVESGAPSYHCILVDQESPLGSSTFENIEFAMPTVADENNILYAKLVPIMRVGGSTEVKNSWFNSPYSKIEIDNEARYSIFRNNTWYYEPYFINSYGRNMAVADRMNEYYIFRSGQSISDTPVYEHLWDNYKVAYLGTTPQRMNRVAHPSNMVTQGKSGEFVASTSLSSIGYTGWKNTKSDNSTDCEMWDDNLTGITGTMNSGSNALSVTSVNSFHRNQCIGVAGAGAGGVLLSTVVEFIDGATKTIYTANPAVTSVTDAVLTSPGPTWTATGYVPDGNSTHVLHGDGTWSAP